MRDIIGALDKAHLILTKQFSESRSWLRTTTPIRGTFLTHFALGHSFRSRNSKEG
ncbi:hypothetical protein Scep_010367 [Stephania cephalantha]|uniref:Uncharacterized protein n=1 Tax=Stephania cephalantha TaxID=152367 RepID=A0AAP0JVB2_9MAGN